MQVRVIMLVDLDYFFAQCEELRNPALKDKPVVVCVYSGRTPDSGVVSTANYIARRYGVKSGMPIFMAHKRLEENDAVFLPVDHEFYEKTSERIMDLLRTYADRFEQVGIDEAYLNVSQRTKASFEEARILALRMKEEMKNLQGLTCSVGIGPNKLIAKIAADFQKPDAVTLVRPDEAQSFLSPLPVDRLLGVGRKTTEKMQSMGINTISDLARYDVQKLTEAFGKTIGIYFHEISEGRDETPVEERGEVESLSRISTLKEDTRDLNMILEKTNQLCDDVCARIMQRGISFKSVGIAAVMADLSVHSRSKTMESFTSDRVLFKRTVKDLFEKLLTEYELAVRRVGVRVSNLAVAQRSQKQITSYIKPVEE